MRNGKWRKYDKAEFAQAYSLHVKELGKPKATEELVTGVVAKLKSSKQQPLLLRNWECLYCQDYEVQATQKPSNCPKCKHGTFSEKKTPATTPSGN